jgi:hypothetical protein
MSLSYQFSPDEQQGLFSPPPVQPPDLDALYRRLDDLVRLYRDEVAWDATRQRFDAVDRDEESNAMAAAALNEIAARIKRLEGGTGEST